MQISIQSLEITHNKVPYRFVVKKVFDTSNNAISFHCWAPEDQQAKDLIRDEVLTFEWDSQRAEIRPRSENPVSNTIKEAIRELFAM